MTSLELRLIAYGLLAIILLGGSAYLGYRVTARHYVSLIAADKAAQDVALQDAQLKVIAAQNERAAAIQKSEKDHAQLVANNQRTVDSLTGQLRDLETALSAGPLSGAMGNPGQPGGTSAGAPSDRELANALEDFNRAAQGSAAACLHDSAELAGILAVAPH